VPTCRQVGHLLHACDLLATHITCFWEAWQAEGFLVYECKVLDKLLPVVQDVIARAGRFWGLYKRAGQRVMINPSGDLIVRPTFIEAAAQVMRPWGALWASSSLHTSLTS